MIDKNKVSCWHVRDPDEKPELIEAQEFVGGCVEILQMSNCQVLINDEGLLTTLPTNKEVTKLVNQIGEYIIDDTRGIVGNAIILYGDAQWT